MAALDKLKKQTNAYKSHLARSLTSLNDQLIKTDTDRDNTLMLEYLNQVELKYDRWEAAMNKVQEKDPDVDIEKSINEIDAMQNLVIKSKVQATEIQKKSKVVAEPEKVDTNTAHKAKDRMNLPKLELKKFSGENIEYYQEWFQIFNATIDKSSLSTVEKFIYLKMSLEKGSEAEKLIEGYTVTEGNYTSAMHDLHDAYGDPQVVINHHVSKLLNLPKQSGPQSLRDLYNSISTHVRSLDALGITSDQYSVFLVPIIMSKLNDTLRLEITKKKVKNVTQMLNELREEVENECSSNQVKLAFQQEADTRDSKPPMKSKSWSNTPYQQPYASAQVLTATSRSKYCIFCPSTQSHWVEDCRKLKNLNPKEVRETAMNENACLLCFKRGHRSFDCKSRGRIKCEICQSTRHNTALHDGERKGAYVTLTSKVEVSKGPTQQLQVQPQVNTQPQEVQVKADNVPPPAEVKGAIAIHAKLGNNDTIMPIIKVRVVGNNGKRLELNALLDPCSDQSFIRQDVTQALHLDGPPVQIEVAGITGMTDSKKDRKLITTKLFSRDFNKEIEVNLVEMPIICKPIARPAVSHHVLSNRNLRNLQLADSYDNKETREIHLLIGLDHYYSVITGRIKRGINQPVAVETMFGWMLVSDSQNEKLKSKQNITTMFISTETEQSLHEDMRKFWELEEEIVSKPVKPENEAAIRKFYESVTYDSDAKKYEVGLPYIGSKEIHSNYKKAEIILHSQLKRFEKNPVLKEQYYTAMNEYINQDFAELVPDDQIYSRAPNVYYIPHSAVIKDDSTSTKTRIVFNASSSSKGQKSLNDKLLVGPKLQPSIPEILIRWRTKDVALVADIKKMYSMIQVHEEDRDALRFLWVDEDNKVRHYRHKVLPFGVRPAPYLAIETVHSHIMKFSEQYPEVTESLLESTYVDDFCAGEENTEAAINTVTASNQIMDAAGMKLTKWKSNNEDVMKFMKETDPSTDTETNERKVLGAQWNREKDVFFYQVNPTVYPPSTFITKRMIVGAAAKIHDPLGFIAPVIVTAKMMIQQLWAAGVEWDENLAGTQIAEQYMNWVKDLENLKEIEINRQYVPPETNVKSKQMHIFNDASEKSYATVAYLRSEEESGNIHTALITAKTKVAPLKVITLPRLELMSALIGSRLSQRVVTALKDPNLKIYFWSDSTITLNWIKNTEVRWKTFVENRVAEIRENSDPVMWRHCPGKENPADIASRGATVLGLQEATSWWGGPCWLKQSEDQWPERTNSLVPNKEALQEKRSKQVTCLVADTRGENSVISRYGYISRYISGDRYSKFSKLLRITAYLMRFTNNCRRRKENKPLILSKFPTPEEMSEAQKYWLCRVQEEYYPEEISKLKTKLPVKQDSKIVQLSPYYDEGTELIRMKGRVQNSRLTLAEKHPIILPHQSQIVRLLVESIHQDQMHSGVNHTLVTLRNEFWVTHSRSVAKNVVRSCLTCRRYMPSRITVPMAPLPAERVTEATPFQIIGVDFTGPIYVAEERKLCAPKKPTRKSARIAARDPYSTEVVEVVHTKKSSKCYIALTTCAVTRAVHLELVPDLSTDSFMRSFRRFSSRRGTCSVIYSDNAKTYKSAEKGVQQCYEMLNSPQFQEYLSEKSIKWKFICPLSPWWGGYWERLMKTIKVPLKKVLGKSFLNSDELYTVLTEVEAMVNSRPICAVSDDPDDLSYLTPANFLIGRSTINLPVAPLTHTEVHPTATRKQLNEMLRYQEKTLKKSWKVWREEYIRGLGVCPAIRSSITLQVGELVMVASNKQPRCTWKTGRVEELIDGRDGRVRSAIVRVGGKSLTRPVQLLSQLEARDLPAPAQL